MVVAGDFKNGVTFEMDDGSVVQVVEFQHVKPGKGAAFVRTKIRNVITGAVTERRTLTSREERCSTPTMTVISITSWIQRHGKRLSSTTIW